MNAVTEKFKRRKPELERELGEELSISGLAGPLRIFQRVKGHRHSIDDATTAWYALSKCPSAKRSLDLGTGIGTVGLAVLWGMGAGSSLVCVEAQEISYRLLTENIRGNGLADSVAALHADLRTIDLQEKFELVTGSPPYFPVDSGVLPSDSQKAHARFELRGDVGDYARAAKRHLADGGVFVFCFPYQQRLRGIRLVEEAGFSICTIRDVVPRAQKPPLFSLYSARLNWNGATVVEPQFVVAGDDLRYSDEMLEVQRTRGFGPEGTNLLE